MGLFPKWFHLSYLASTGGWWRGPAGNNKQQLLAPDLWQCDAVSRIHQPRDTRPAHRHQLTLQDTCLGNYWPMVQCWTNTKQKHRQLSNTSISSQTFVHQWPLVKANFMKTEGSWTLLMLLIFETSFAVSYSYWQLSILFLCPHKLDVEAMIYDIRMETKGWGPWRIVSPLLRLRHLRHILSNQLVFHISLARWPQSARNVSHFHLMFRSSDTR